MAICNYCNHEINTIWDEPTQQYIYKLFYDNESDELYIFCNQCDQWVKCH